MPVDIAFTRLTSARDQTGIGADVFATGKAVRIFDAGREREGSDRANTGNAHQPNTDRISGSTAFQQSARRAQLRFNHFHGRNKRRKQRLKIRSLLIQNQKPFVAFARRSGRSHAKAKQFQKPAQLIGHSHARGDQLGTNPQRRPVDMRRRSLHMDPLEPASPGKLR